MAIKKGVFDEYVKARETSSLSSILHKKAKYTHNRVFDPIPSTSKEKDKKESKNRDKNISIHETRLNTNDTQTVDKLDSKPRTNRQQTTSNLETNERQTSRSYITFKALWCAEKNSACYI